MVISRTLIVSLFAYIATADPRARCSSVVRSFMVDLLSYFSFQSVLHDWCNKGRGCSTTPDLQPCTKDDNPLQFYFNATNGKCTKASSWPTKICVASEHSSFKDYISCVHTCECTQLPKENRCTEGQTSEWGQTDRWFFNSRSGICEPFTNYGCLDLSNPFIGLNDFVSKSACTHQCLCTKPLDAGTGEQCTASFAFNAETKSCDVFVYKGKGGNANRFATSETCMDTCVCGLEAQNGNGAYSCYAFIVTYVYDKKENACKKFIYGGCGGNSNRFDTKEKCAEVCSKG